MVVPAAGEGSIVPGEVHIVLEGGRIGLGEGRSSCCCVSAKSISEGERHSVARRTLAGAAEGRRSSSEPTC